VVVLAELTDSLTVWAEWVRNYLDNETWKTEAGIAQVLYGDRDRIGVVPLVCIEPSEKGRRFVGAHRRTEIDFEVYVLVYYGTMQATADNRKEVDAIAEAVELRLNSALTCDGLVINSLVTNLTSGVANKGGSFIRATRLTFTATSRVNLPMGV
jgi:hypothetical protein